MVEKLLEFLAHLKSGAAVGVFVVGTTGVLITGTVVNGDVRLHVSPAVAVAAVPGNGPTTSDDDEDEDEDKDKKESAACVEAVRARDDALRAVAVEKEKALKDLHTLREIAASLARKANKDLSDETLATAQRALALDIDRVAADAARAIREFRSLAQCEDGDPATGLVLDLTIAKLRESYQVIVDKAKGDLQVVLQEAAAAFQKLIDAARVKKQQASSASGGSGGSSD